MAEPIDLAYAAGFIDADGTIFLTKQINSRFPRGFHLSPVISVISVDHSIMEFFVDTFGGTRYNKSPPRAGDKRIQATLPAYHWTIGSQKALAVARQVAPYLRIKRRQAELLIAYYDEALWRVKGSTNPGRMGGISMPEEEMQRRLDIRDAISSLNRRDYLRPKPAAA